MIGELLMRFLSHGIAINPVHWKIRRINNVYTIGYKGAPERPKVCSIAMRNLNAPKDVRGRYSDNVLIKRALGRTLSNRPARWFGNTYRRISGQSPNGSTSIYAHE